MFALLCFWILRNPSKKFQSISKSDPHFLILFHASQRQLLSTSPWKTIQKWKSFAFSEDHLDAQSHFETVERTRKQEAYYRAKREAELEANFAAEMALEEEAEGTARSELAVAQEDLESTTSEG